MMKLPQKSDTSSWDFARFADVTMHRDTNAQRPAAGLRFDTFGVPTRYRSVIPA